VVVDDTVDEDDAVDDNDDAVEMIGSMKMDGAR